MGDVLEKNEKVYFWLLRPKRVDASRELVVKVWKIKVFGFTSLTGNFIEF
jgi:hypothetical protein